jgi:hypothetical protein
MLNIGEVLNNPNFQVDWSADRRACIQPEGFELWINKSAQEDELSILYVKKSAP